MNPQDMSMIVAGVVILVLLAFAAAVLWAIFSDKVDLSGLIAEQGAGAGKPGKASLSRFQFLIFTFVIAGLYLVLSLEAGNFIEIPANVLALMGISGGSYVVSKGIEKHKG